MQIAAGAESSARVYPRTAAASRASAGIEELAPASASPCPAQNGSAPDAAGRRAGRTDDPGRAGPHGTPRPNTPARLRPPVPGDSPAHPTWYDY